MVGRVFRVVFGVGSIATVGGVVITTSVVTGCPSVGVMVPPEPTPRTAMSKLPSFNLSKGMKKDSCFWLNLLSVALACFHALLLTLYSTRAIYPAVIVATPFMVTEVLLVGFCERGLRTIVG